MRTMTLAQKIRAVTLLTFLATAVATGINSPMVFAADDGVPVPGAEQSSFVINAVGVQLALGLVIPLINGLITKYTLGAAWKFLITTVLNAATAMITAGIVVGGAAVISWSTVYSTIFGVVVSQLMYNGIYSKNGLTSSDPNGKLAPTTGIGPAVPAA